jgi:hypothetical protein
MGIGSSVVLIPLFGVDVPASSEGIGLCSEFTRTETDNEVELVEVFRPTGLTTGKHLRSSEVLEVLVVRDDVGGNGRAFEVMMPLSESFENGKEFFVVRIVVQLRSSESTRIEHNGTKLVIGAVEREDAGYGIVGGISLHN